MIHVYRPTSAGDSDNALMPSSYSQMQQTYVSLYLCNR